MDYVAYHCIRQAALLLVNIKLTSCCLQLSLYRVVQENPVYLFSELKIHYNLNSSVFQISETKSIKYKKMNTLCLTLF